MCFLRIDFEIIYYGWTRNVSEDVIDLTDLSEMELRILEEYEKNTNVILTQLDQSVRVEIRRKYVLLSVYEYLFFAFVEILS